MRYLPSDRVTGGFGLIELLVSVTIATILFSYALPNMSSLWKRYHVEAQQRQFATLIQAARHAAIQLNLTVTLCPGVSGTCAGRNQWQLGAFAFGDLNNNRRTDPGEPILASIGKLDSDITWRSFRNRNVLQFKPSGLTPWQNGHFLFCPADGDAQFARQLVLNAAGRLYFSKDRNSDGWHESVRGQPLVC